jgi:hypothetical protein
LDSHRVDSTDFTIAGVRQGADSLAVLRILGRPASVDSQDDFRDPGAKLISWSYPGLIVLLGSYNSVGGFWLTDTTFATARGLRVGATRERVRDVYGRPDDMYEGMWIYSSTYGFGMEQIRIQFTEGLVTRIYVGHIYD